MPGQDRGPRPPVSTSFLAHVIRLTRRSERARSVLPLTTYVLKRGQLAKSEGFREGKSRLSEPKDIIGSRTGEDRIFTLPNLISFIRLLLIPVFFILYVFCDQKVAGLAIFVIAACTDWIDGMVARSTGQVTKLGKVLDPFVDRILIIFGVIAVVATGRAPIWIMILVFARDIILGIFTIHLKKKHGNDLTVSYVGKTATAFIMTAFAMLLLDWPMVPGLGLFEVSWLPGFGEGTFCLGLFLAYVGIVLQWIAAVIYLYRGTKYGTTAARKGRGKRSDNDAS